MKTYNRIIITALFAIMCSKTFSQININIQVKPPYQSRIAEYASRPDLILLTLTNTSTTEQRIQLTGSITGNNGVSVQVRPSYRSPSPLLLAPGQVLAMDATAISFLFNYSSVEMKGISLENVVYDARLPEGVYQLCIRALDYDTRQPISMEEPMGCTMFFINDLEPPIITAPMHGTAINSAFAQTFPITWLTPPGAVPSTQYKVKIVEIIANRDPNDAMRSATTPPFFERTVTGINSLFYGPADPALTPGREYAVMVQAIDPSGQSVFRNSGMSEVYAFTYSAPVAFSQTISESSEQIQPRHLVVINDAGVPDCDCKEIPGNNTAPKDIVVGNTLIIGGNYRMTVSRADKNTTDQTFSGEGVVPLPVIGNAPGLRLRVAFSGMKVNSANRMVAGVVKGIVSDDAPTFIPRVDAPAVPGFKPSINDIKNMDDYLKNKTSQLVSSLKNSVNTAGFELPFGIDKSPVTIGIYNITFNAEQAWFSASAAMDIPDANERIALQARAVCMDNEGFCNSGILELAEDFTIPGLNLTLLAVTEGNNKDGTYIKFTGNGFEELFIDSRYTFPAATLVSTLTNRPLEARLTASTTQGWGNWIAEGSLDPFIVNGVTDFKFSLAQGKKFIYDHADNRNAQGMPTNIPYGNNNSLSFTDDWHGFYFPELVITLPPAIKNATNNQDISFSAKNMVFDNRGFSGSFGVDNLLALDDGSLDGWYFSVDRIEVNFFKSSFINGGMNGRLMLPVSGNFVKNDAGKQRQKELNYTCNLSSPEGQSMMYSFMVTLKNNIDFQAWWAHASIGGGSNILISGGGGESFTATASLNGSLSIVAEIPKLPNIALGHVSFTNMQLSTKDGFTPGQFSVGLGGAPSGQAYNNEYLSDDYLLAENYFAGKGPNSDNYYVPDVAVANQSGGSSQQSLMGFNFSIRKVEPYFADGNIGLTFDTHMQLVNGVDFIPKADLKFSFFANPSAISGGRKVWEAVGGEIEAVKLDVNANLAGLKVSGEIRYFDTQNSGYTDHGFGGKLSVVLPVGGMGIAMQGLFGTRSGNGVRPFQFFYIDGVFEMGSSGIPLFPGTQLHGFAGGAYYNMERVAEENPVTNVAPNTSMPDENDPQYQNMTSFSGVKYTPTNAGQTTLGFMAGIYLGLNAREVLDAELVLEMMFRNGSFKEISLNGRGAFVNSGETFNERYESAMGKGEMRIAVIMKDADQGGGFDKFEMSSKVNINYPVGAPILTAESNMVFVIEEGEGWYIKIGTPMERDRVSIGYKNIFSVEAQTYFEAGSFNIDELPPVPAGILAIIHNGNSNQRSEENSSIQQTAHKIPGEEGKRTSEKGVIFGAALEFKADPSFAIFYAHLYAGVGLDLSFKDYDTRICSNGGTGWYLKGQAFMGASAACGVKINVFGLKKNIEFLSAGVAATVDVGLPNPTYISGKLAGYFSVLDGLIEKDFRIKFSVGEKCELISGVEELDLIEELYPAKGAQDVSILARPAVSFNFPINTDFVIPLDYETEDGDYYTEYVLFRINRDGLQANITGGGLHFTIEDFPNYDIYRGRGGKITAMSMKNDAGFLLPETQYTFDVRAKVKKAVFNSRQITPSKEFLESQIDNRGTQFVFVKKAGTNTDYEDTRSITFKTGKGPKNIPVDNVAEVLPYHRAQNLPLGAVTGVNNGMGYIKLIMGMTPEHFDSNITNPTAMIRFVTIAGDDVGVHQQLVQITDNGKLWQFPMPALIPGTQYVAKVFFKNTATQGSSGQGPISERVITEVRNIEDGIIELRRNRLTATDALQMAPGDQELFAWYFKTGNDVSDYKTKYNSMKLEKMKIDGAEVSIHQNQQINMANLNWTADETTKTINSLMLVEYYYSSQEPFNVLDIDNYQRSRVFPQATTEGLAADANRIIWKNMIERSGIDPLSSVIDEAVAKQMLTDFSNVAFGAGRQLELNPLSLSWNAATGGIGRRGTVRYDNTTQLMPTRLWDVDYSKNTLVEPVQSNNVQTETPTPSSNLRPVTVTLTQKLVNDINSNTSNVVHIFNPAEKRYDYIYTDAASYQSGQGVVNVGNGMMGTVIQAAKNLGRPADIFLGLPSMGIALDNAIGSQNKLNGSISPPKGLGGPGVRTR